MKQKLLITAIFTILGLSACGPQAFVPDTVVSDQSAAGDMSLPPKVDIVLGISDGGTMQNIYPGIAPELVTFTNNLQAQGWDYRFVAISLNQNKPGSSYNIINKVSASQYHTNYPQSQWLPPYPGATYFAPSTTTPNPMFFLDSSLFSTAFVIPTLDTSANNGLETGLKNEADFVNRSDVKTNFLRSDAMLAVITLSNGKDASDGWYSAWNGQQANPVNVDNYVNQIKAAKTSAAMAKYYALVAHYATTCRSSAYSSWSGSDYELAASKMGGISTDICTNTTSAALASVSQNLDIQKLSFQKKYLVIGTEPNVATIKVTKNGVVVPADSSNGWTYAGHQSDLETIDAPVPMAKATGYFIELHGSAKLHGADKGRVEYMNAGSVSSH